MAKIRPVKPDDDAQAVVPVTPPTPASDPTGPPANGMTVDAGATDGAQGEADLGDVPPSPPRRSWELPSAATGPRRADLATDIMNIMEQGILVWSANGYCEMHNTRVFTVLELGKGVLEIGTQRDAFRGYAFERDEFTDETEDYCKAQILAHQPYSHDRQLPSGRVVLTNGRPMRGGGYVMTFTDVTEARAAERALFAAQQQAEAARAQAVDVLENERARRTEAKLLTSLDEWLQSCKSLGELFLIVRRFMERLLPGSEGELYVYSNSRDALEGVCEWNTTTIKNHIAADSCWALRRGRAYHHSPDEVSFLCDHVAVEAINDLQSDARYICVPIMAHGDTVGLLHIRLADNASARFADPVTFAIQCGEHISMAIANVKLRDELHEQSVRDALTGLYNRRYFMNMIRREMSSAARTDAPLGMISFDADKFKSFNDLHGHEAGDLVLGTIGRTLVSTLAGKAVGCRIGGEEFAVLVPGADLEAAAEIAEDLRRTIGHLQVKYLNGTLPQITISLGVAAFPQHGEEPQLLMREADAALYEAKGSGRNCVRLAQ